MGIPHSALDHLSVEERGNNFWFATAVVHVHSVCHRLTGLNSWSTSGGTVWRVVGLWVLWLQAEVLCWGWHERRHPLSRHLMWMVSTACSSHWELCHSFPAMKGWSVSPSWPPFPWVASCQLLGCSDEKNEWHTAIGNKASLNDEERVSLLEESLLACPGSSEPK